MARQIQIIKQVMLDQKAAMPVLNALNSTSAVAVWNLILYIVAASIWALETLQDIFTQQINDTIATLKPHSNRWYANIALQFMYGLNLVAESDYYDTTGMTDAQIAAAKIVAYAAVVEQERGIRIKVAKLAGSDLTFLSDAELLAFTEYMSRVKDAGVKLLITSGVADSLQLTLQVFYNPLVLDYTGARLDGTDATPVQSAVDAYLKNLPFNGVFVTEYLIDALQKVDGVVIPHLFLASARYGALLYTNFAVKYTPDAGYLRVYTPTDLTIQFTAQSVI